VKTAGLFYFWPELSLLKRGTEIKKPVPAANRRPEGFFGVKQPQEEHEIILLLFLTPKPPKGDLNRFQDLEGFSCIKLPQRGS
jgi:hypothetical protein